VLGISYINPEFLYIASQSTPCTFVNCIGTRLVNELHPSNIDSKLVGFKGYDAKDTVFKLEHP
jgi:hypothetical protein